MEFKYFCKPFKKNIFFLLLTIENIILVGSILLLISIFAGKTSYRFGVPTLIFFLGVGMLAGEDGIGGIVFDNPQIAQMIGVISLNFILFNGGLDTDWKAIRPVLKEGIVLSSLGVLLTALTLGGFVYYLTDFTIYESLLLGSIVSSTDAAAVFSILRAKSLALRTNLRPTLELESGSNDPMAYVLTILFLGLVMNPEQSIVSMIPIFLQQMILGTIAGFAFGRISKIIINRIKLDIEGLYPVLVIALMFITFSVTDFFGGNGFLAIYICGLYLGNKYIMHKKTIIRMYDGLAWLMQIVLFLTLGLLVNPSQLVSVFSVGILISLFLMLVARPFSVFVSLLFFKMRIQRRLYISWVGLRGAVPIVFATYPLLAGIDSADMIFNIVFFIALTSLLVQGTSLGVVAKWLGVSMPSEEKILSPSEEFMLEHPKTAMREIGIGNANYITGKKIVDIEFPQSAIIAMIKRDGKYIMPDGSTVIEAGDVLVVLANSKEKMKEVFKALRIRSYTV